MENTLTVTQANTTYIKAVLKELNRRASSLKGKRISDFSEFHGQISELINPYLYELGMKYGIWSVEDSKEYRGAEWYLFRMNLKLREDKRCKHNRQGWIERVWFLPYHLKEYTTSVTVKDYKNAVNKKKIEQDIKENKEFIVKKEKEILEAKKYIEHLEFNKRLL